MATGVRFRLDENVDHAIARGLRLGDIDVTTANDAGLLGGEDAAHLAFALADERVVVTHDPEFLADACRRSAACGNRVCSKRGIIDRRHRSRTLPHSRLPHSGTDEEQGGVRVTSTLGARQPW